MPSDSTQAMASLMSAYGDEEADDDTVHDTSGMAAAQLDDDDVLSPDTRTHPGANFISDDEDGHRSPHERVDESAKQEDTKSPIAERLPPQRTGTVREFWHGLLTSFNHPAVVQQRLVNSTLNFAYTHAYFMALAHLG